MRRLASSFFALGLMASIAACSSKADRKMVDDDPEDRPRSVRQPTELEALQAHLAEVAARIADTAAQPAETATPAAPPPPKPTSNRFAIKGPMNSPDPHIARQAALADAAEFGVPSPPTGVGISVPNAVGTSAPPASLHASGTTVSGRLPPEVIQRIVRRNFGQLRTCYETGLRSNPALEGRVEIDFVIGLDGSVGSVATSGTMPDAAVNGCIAKAFAGFMFPAPEGGVVKVKYPISFTPAESPPTPPTTPSGIASVSAMSKATIAEVTKALLDAGCTDLQLVSSTPAEGTTFVVKKGGRAFTVTFVGASDPKLDDAYVKALEAKGAVRHGGASEGNFLFAVVADDGDQAAAKALLDAVLPPP